MFLGLSFKKINSNLHLMESAGSIGLHARVSMFQLNQNKSKPIIYVHGTYAYHALFEPKCDFNSFKKYSQMQLFPGYPAWVTQSSQTLLSVIKH